MPRSPQVPASDNRLVWYAGYGSNLRRERFDCYIYGGQPLGSAKEYPGCRDKSAPRGDQPVTLQHALYFADHSNNWNGAVAFIRAAASDAVTYARMYQITYGQFNDVVRQENARDVPGAIIVPPYEQLSCTGPWQIAGLRLYGRLLKTGMHDQCPILTFTASQDDFVIGAPSEAYIRMIAAGLAETYPRLPHAEMLTHLRSADGVRNTIPEQQLTQWVRGT